ncbi:hypothetical protein BFP70_01490 [Thioclava sp. SK-1]|uniref:alpha/beta hydrolase n=1 Tax=Thioclava sp. SK-1 TaxID=1889770 RepID=UPI000825B0AD|nr:alpha/beta hydrolase-fold protein [Thioclava sp. SK-1]OCX61279.1 hypothetical protein BFP70_01490 [Thioclava sp. SK-1]
MWDTRAFHLAVCEWPQMVPPAQLDLPPHRGQVVRHELLGQGCDSHDLSVQLTGISHPLCAAGAAPYTVFRAVPKGQAPAHGWPVLYLLDGNAAFDFLTADLLAHVPDLMIVGVGQQCEGQFDRDARARDLTFGAAGQHGLAADAGYGDRLTGGGAQFSALLTGALRRVAEEGVQVDPARRTLWGHSLGGLFVVNQLLRHPESFAQFAAISPSLWWHPERLAPFLAPPQTWAKNCTGRRAYLASGTREKRTGSPGPQPDAAPAAFDQLIATLAAPGTLNVTHQIYDGAVHIATLPSSLPWVLGFAADCLPTL